MSGTSDPRVLTAAEAARLLGVPRRRVLELADSVGFPPAERSSTDGRPVHIVVDEHGIPVLDEHGREQLGPVEVPDGGTVVARHE
jgi:hypothetical protein